MQDDKAEGQKKEWRRHFYGQGDVEIHTTRTPKCKQREICEYKNEARKVIPYRKQQDHHLIPVGMMIRYQDPKQKYEDDVIQLIDTAYRNQKYCANNAKNLWWLPTKPTYLGKPRRSPVWDLNLPCHTIGHPTYNKEVVEELKSRIWEVIKKKKDDKDCPPAPDLVKLEFENLEKDFKNRLHYRRYRPGMTGGTRWAIDNAGQRDDWWYAFSMADIPDCTDAVETFITKEIPASLRRK